MRTPVEEQGQENSLKLIRKKELQNYHLELDSSHSLLKKSFFSSEVTVIGTHDLPNNDVYSLPSHTLNCIKLHSITWNGSRIFPLGFYTEGNSSGITKIECLGAPQYKVQVSSPTGALPATQRCHSIAHPISFSSWNSLLILKIPAWILYTPACMRWSISFSSRQDSQMVCNLHCLHLSTTTLLTHHRFLVHQPMPTELSMPIELGTSAEGICGLLPPLCLHRSTKVLHGGLFFCVQFSILRPFSSPRPISQSSLPNPDSVVSLFNILSPFLESSFPSYLFP